MIDIVPGAALLMTEFTVGGDSWGGPARATVNMGSLSRAYTVRLDQYTGTAENLSVPAHQLGQ